MMKYGTIIFAATLTGLLAIGARPAAAQFQMPGVDLSGEQQVDKETQARRDEVDRQYRGSKGTLPTQSGAIDPWANMRGADEAKPAAKPATKTAAKPATAAPKKKTVAQ
jgi:hypothetical protein